MLEREHWDFLIGTIRTSIEGAGELSTFLNALADVLAAKGDEAQHDPQDKGDRVIYTLALKHIRDLARAVCEGEELRDRPKGLLPR